MTAPDAQTHETLPEPAQADTDPRYSGIKELRRTEAEVPQPSAADSSGDEEPTNTHNWSQFLRSMPGIVLALGLIYFALAYVVPLLLGR